MSGFLLDTHTWLWAVSQPKKCSARVRRIIDDPTNKLYLSIASAWEMAIKSSLGKLRLTTSGAIDMVITRINADSNVSMLSINLVDVAEVETLAWNHRDPFDRMIIAQAKTNNLTIISADEHLKSYGVKVVW